MALNSGIGEERVVATADFDFLILVVGCVRKDQLTPESELLLSRIFDGLNSEEGREVVKDREVELGRHDYDWKWSVWEVFELIVPPFDLSKLVLPMFLFPATVDYR